MTAAVTLAIKRALNCESDPIEVQKRVDLTRELEVAKAAAVEAGRVILEVYNHPFDVEYKSDQSPLTDADRQSNEVISRMLYTAFPSYALLTEEGQDDSARLANDWCWIVDPLDGTKEFVKRNGEFTVNIALAHKQRVVLGVIAVPVSGELYYAARGFDAFRESSSHVERLAVSSIRRARLRLAMSRSHALAGESKRLLEAHEHDIAEVKRVGSSLKGCLVASGEAEVYYRFGPTMEWDTAAMQCIVEEAGGVVRQLDGSELLYNRANSRNEKGFYVINHLDNELLGGGGAGVDAPAASGAPDALDASRVPDASNAADSADKGKVAAG